MRVRVGFSRGRSFFAKVICLVTGADISHSFFLVEDGDEAWAYEAVLGRKGFRRVPWAIYQRHNEIKDLVGMSWPDEEVKDNLDSMLGTRYSMRRFFLVGVMLLLKRPVDCSTDTFDCVSSVVKVTARFGKSIVGRTLTPAELRQRMGP
jgi:hypothetical protein